MSSNTEDIISALGVELVRIGASLRMHPHSPEDIFYKPEVSLPLIIAALNYHSTSDGQIPKVRGAFLRKMETSDDLPQFKISTVEISHIPF